MPRLHVVDGTFELYRAHFSPRPGFEDPAGRDRKATVGVVESLLGLLRDAEEEVTHLAVAFDNPIRSFRNDLFAGYKSDEGVPPELREQFGPVEEAVAAAGIAVWSMQTWEADDAMATAAARFGPAVEQVRLMTPDKDLGQCLREGVVQVDRIRGRVIDEAGFRARYGIAPASMPDYLALVGDSADGIPGVPGFGSKTAAALLGVYAHLEAIPELPSAWQVSVRGAKKLAATLAAHRSEALLYRRLATLVTDVPLPQGSLDELRPTAPGPAWVAWCERMGRSQWIERRAPKS